MEKQEVTIHCHCPYCGKTVDDCYAEMDEIHEQNNRGACEHGPDCDGTKCGLKSG